MKKRWKKGSWLLAGAVCTLLLAGGCRHYEIEVTLNPDGSGSRHVVLTGDPLLDKDSDVTLDQFRDLHHLEKAKGWTLIRQTDSEGEKLSFERTGKIKDLASWNGQSGDIQIDASLTDGPHSNVSCRNTIVVEMVEGPAGGQYTYRERFEWAGLKKLIVTFVAERFGAAMSETYPFLDSEEIAELRGIMAGHLALCPLDPEGKEEKAQQEATIASVTFYAQEIVARDRPEADLPAVRGIAEAAIEDSDGALDRYVGENLQGVELGVLTDVTLRVQMPGPIVETNAEEVQGQIAIRKLDLLDVVEEPVELYVRSQLAGK